MLRRETLRGFFLLLIASPITMANSFVESPGVVRGDVTGSAALEWTLTSEPGSDDAVGFTFNSDDVFRYIPYTGHIPPPGVDGTGGNRPSDSYDPRFAIYNTSTRGVGFRLAGLRLQDPGNYTCRYESLVQTVETAVLFVYDVPDRPVIEVSPQILVEGVTSVSLGCGASSTSLPVANRPAMLYTWRRNGVDIDRTGSPERHAVLGDSGQTLEISPVHHTDTAYTCTASESGTQLTSEETEFTLDVLHGPYNLTTNPRNSSARENEALKITALADCNPACSFTWSVGDDVIGHDPVLSFDRFHLRDASNYTVIAANLYGAADLTVEVTLDTSPGQHTVPGGSEFSTTDGGVTFTYSSIVALGGSSFVIVASAAAGGVLLIIIIVVAVCCARRRRKPASEYVNSEVLGEPDHSTSDYINPDVFRELGQPTGDYITTDVFREPGQPTGDYVNSEICRKPTSAGHPHADASGHYESIDMATREPADPINRVYEALQQ